MIVIDWVIIAVVVISSIIGLMKGFVKEALSLITWLAAFAIARFLSGNLATLLIDFIDTPSARWIISFVILFAGTIVVGAMVNHLLAEMVRLTGLGSTDKMFGMIFGSVRGILILVAVVYMLQYTQVPQDPWWQKSYFLPHLEMVADWARKTLPAATEQVMSFSR